MKQTVLPRKIRGGVISILTLLSLASCKISQEPSAQPFTHTLTAVIHYQTVIDKDTDTEFPDERQYTISKKLSSQTLSASDITDLKNLITTVYALTFAEGIDGWYTDSNFSTPISQGDLTPQDSGQNYAFYEIHTKVTEDVAELLTQYVIRDAEKKYKLSELANAPAVLLPKDTTEDNIKELLKNAGYSDTIPFSVDLPSKTEENEFIEWNKESSLQGEKGFFITLDKTFAELKDYFINVVYSPSFGSDEYYLTYSLPNSSPVSIASILKTDTFAQYDTSAYTAKEIFPYNTDDEESEPDDLEGDLLSPFTSIYIQFNTLPVHLYAKNGYASQLIKENLTLTAPVITENDLNTFTSLAAEYGLTVQTENALSYLTNSGYTSLITIDNELSSDAYSGGSLTLYISVEQDIESLASPIFVLDSKGRQSANLYTILLHPTFTKEDRELLEKYKWVQSSYSDADVQNITQISVGEEKTSVAIGSTNPQGKTVYLTIDKDFTEIGYFVYQVYSPQSYTRNDDDTIKSVESWQEEFHTFDYQPVSASDYIANSWYSSAKIYSKKPFATDDWQSSEVTELVPFTDYYIIGSSAF